MIVTNRDYKGRPVCEGLVSEFRREHHGYCIELVGVVHDISRRPGVRASHGDHAYFYLDTADEQNIYVYINRVRFAKFNELLYSAKPVSVVLVVFDIGRNVDMHCLAVSKAR